jgi:DNA polymerase (family 10)
MDSMGILVCMKDTINQVTDSVIDLLHEIQRLMELKGENPFKIRAFERAAQSLAEHTDLKERAKAGTLQELPGIGKGISDVLTEYLLKGTCSAKDELLASLPAGLLEMTQIPGLGPKKAATLIETLGVQSLAELEYACRENRLLKIKGFGPKVQQKILEGIIFFNSNRGLQKISDALPTAEAIVKVFKEDLPGIQFSETGAFRRRAEILDRLDFLFELQDGKDISGLVGKSLSKFQKENPSTLPIEVSFASTDIFGYELARTTATDQHWAALGETLGKNKSEFENYFKNKVISKEEDFYQHLGLPWLPPEIRETGEEVKLAKTGLLDELLPWDGIKGVFHNHTTRSDGTATLEEMVTEAVRLGYEYIGISDHSQSAFYAQGLKEADLLSQEKEIRVLQSRFPQIRIFWGIESDILADGSLDYTPEFLKRFDFVIASIHSRFNMDRDAMTERILTAIRNPYTRFLGHPTGRLLLGRKGYEMDMEAVISEAAHYGVVVELNSNPNRLDLDWRWGSLMRKKKALTSINPDAHNTAGLSDVQFGVAMARKALLPTRQVINSRSAQEVEKWLRRSLKSGEWK